MNNLFDYNAKKNYLTTDLKLEKLVFSDQLKSEENINQLVRIFITELRFNTTDTKKVKELIKKYIDIWIGLGKFKRIDNDMKQINDYSYKYEMIREYNKKFYDVFNQNIIDGLKESKSYLNDFNPYRATLQNKKINDFTVDDYKNLYVQTDENLIFDFSRRKSLKNNNENIPIYRAQLHKRQYDKEDIGSLYVGEERKNLEYKRYPIEGELFGKLK